MSKWTTRTGAKIALTDLDDEHLRNIATMLAGFGYQSDRPRRTIRSKFL
jgi:hypothetical protein